MCQCHSEDDAARIVDAANKVERLAVHVSRISLKKKEKNGK